MSDRNISNMLYDGRTIEEFINNTPPQNKTATLQTLSENGKDSITGGLFSKSGYGGPHPILFKILFPLEFILSVLNEIFKARLFKRYRTNKNLDEIENISMGWLSVAFDATAIASEVIGLAAAPFLYLANASISLLNAFPRMLYYGMHFASYQIGSRKHNRFTEDYQDVKNNFLDKAKDTASAVVGLVAVGVLIAAPAILGAAAIGVAVTKVTGVAVASIIAAKVVVALVTLSGVLGWIKNKISGNPTAAANPTATAAPEEGVTANQALVPYQKAGTQYLQTYRELNQAAARPRLKVPTIKPRIKLDALDYNYKDLIKEMDACSESSPAQAKEYMLALLKEESYRCGRDDMKRRALGRLTDLIEGRPVIILDATNKIESVRDLIAYYQQRGLTQSIFRSWWRSVSDMQKVFAVADHYVKTYAQPAEVDLPSHIIKRR